MVAFARRFLQGLAVCFVALGTTATVPAAADSSLQLKREAREALSDYGDLERVLQTLSRLTQVVNRLPDPLLVDDPARDPELAFLRVAVAADLLFLAQSRADEAQVAAVADAYGVPAERLHATLSTELDRVAAGPFRGAATQVASTLALAGTGHAAAAGQGVSARGSARDVTFLNRLAAAQRAGQLEVALVAAAGELPEVPVPELAALDGESRALARGLARASQSVALIRAAAASGDPLARALCPRVTALLEALSAEVVVLGSALPEDTAHTEAAANLVVSRPLMVLRVTETAAELRPAGRIRITPKGAVETALGDGPYLPGFAGLEGLASTTEGEGASTGEDELQDYCARSGERSLAVAPTTGLPSQALTQRVLALRRMGCSALVLSARAPDGRMAPLPFSLHVGRDEITTPRQVRVRLGGYTVKHRGHSADVPRVREDGRFRFDPGALSEALSPGHGAVAVSYMAGVPAQELTTALHVASARAGQPAILVVP